MTQFFESRHNCLRFPFENTSFLDFCVALNVSVAFLRIHSKKFSIQFGPREDSYADFPLVLSTSREPKKARILLFNRCRRFFLQG